MPETKLRVLWEDRSHPESWRETFKKLAGVGVSVTLLPFLPPDEMDAETNRLLSNSDAFVIHSGSMTPPDMSEELLSIKAKHPNVKVFLQTDAVNDLTAPLIDGVIGVHLMLDLPTLVNILRGNVKLNLTYLT